MWLVILGLVTGMAIGFFTPVTVPVALSKYFAVALLAGLDSSLGGLRSGFEKHFRLSIFTSGFTFNILMAASLVYLGDLLGIDLYVAAIVVFGMRIFNNITAIRRMMIDKYWIIPKEIKKHHNEEITHNPSWEIKTDISQTNPNPQV
ncbi:MAG: small basic family protein [Candidatus Sericytochromatia bacterium]|nr:small basic family protein [Candidatus Sericytochromatia bacterium]